MSHGFPQADSLDLAAVVNRSELRKREVREQLGPDPTFAGTAGRSYPGFLDAYHGETGVPIAAAAADALDIAWKEVVYSAIPPGYGNREYDKRQPPLLQKLAAAELFERLSHPIDGEPGVRVGPEDVIVCPYSSTMLLEEAIATLAADCPGGAIVCPEGFYKSAPVHIRKSGLRIALCPALPDDSFKLDPAALAELLAELARAGELAGVLLTLPGNPVVCAYSTDELREIGRILLDSGVRVICDMAFDRLVRDHIPLAALRVRTGRGVESLFDRVLTITGNSKGYNASGPFKIGAACSGDTAWLNRIRARLTIAFQRETIHLAGAIIEHTPDQYFDANLDVMLKQQARAGAHIAAINGRDDIARRFGADVLRRSGSPQGMFLTVIFDRAVSAAAGIDNTLQLEDLLLAVAGIDSVALLRTGSERIGVRLNVLAPRNPVGHPAIGDGVASARDDAVLLAELFDRLEQLIRDIGVGLTYRGALADRGLAPLPGLAELGVGQ
ncbi:aminotransferase class I/II-fold pyridoxal phosphate-dependent enzyme [Nocardia sp. NPDC050710]|uniref:aminotransferase class I/II-fold pyridoxal phosphate-dependent enzyme n=1 Tax=Nocardia sp. NPDC050710 TaxID=3157220 RepID=UPI0033F7A5D8